MKRLTYFLILSLFILGNTGCSKDDDFVAYQNLIGSWFLAYDVDHPTDSYRQEWTFMSDGTFEYAFKVIAKDSGDLLGYNRLSQGTYSIERDTLYIISKLFSIESNELSYTDKETLLLNKAEESQGNLARLEFKDDATKVVFIYLECNDVANCPGSREFSRM